MILGIGSESIQPENGLILTPSFSEIIEKTCKTDQYPDDLEYDERYEIDHNGCNTGSSGTQYVHHNVRETVFLDYSEQIEQECKKEKRDPYRSNDC